jgi:hypothetical protein
LICSRRRAIFERLAEAGVSGRCADLELENAQLRRALATRIMIEQAKGILAERLGLGVDDAFALLRRSARSSRRRIHELATEVTTQRETPREIQRLLRSSINVSTKYSASHSEQIEPSARFA